MWKNDLSDLPHKCSKSTDACSKSIDNYESLIFRCNDVSIFYDDERVWGCSNIYLNASIHFLHHIYINYIDQMYFISFWYEYIFIHSYFSPCWRWWWWWWWWLIKRCINLSCWKTQLMQISFEPWVKKKLISDSIFPFLAPYLLF